jgi:hypothetical protein
MWRMKPVASALGLLPLIFWAGAADAKPRAAMCAIKTSGNAAYRGPCTFNAEAGGSFSIAPRGKRRFPGVTSISLHVVEPGLGEVRGLTRDGINSRWGEARRSRRDRACWQGSDFEVCVR